MTEEMEDIIYFSFNNWFMGRDYPMGKKYSELINKSYFNDEEWVKENKLVVVTGYIDMSVNWCVTATKEWVKINLPELLTNDEYEYIIYVHSKDGEEKVIHHKKYSDFIIQPDEDGEVNCKYGMPFMDYSEENIGVHWWEEVE